MSRTILRDYTSPNFDARTVPVSMVVLHYTGMQDGPSALARLCDPKAKVSAHYCIEEDGRIFQLVDEALRAWHAGVSAWRGVRDINGASIGIELVNPGHEFGYRPFPQEQIAALLWLLGDIVQRHGIAPEAVVGHSDVAPARKTDPGELFPWAELAAHGLAAPTPKAGTAPDWDAAALSQALSIYGYDISDLTKAVQAFQRRFRPRLCDGQADAQTRALLAALLQSRL